MFKQIFDSRGIPTIEASMSINNGKECIASIPSGASTGAYEALEMRDNGPEFFGKGLKSSILKAMDFVNEFLINKTFESQHHFDELLDKKIGANFTLALSLAFCKCICPKNRDLFEFLHFNYFKEQPLKKSIKLMMNVLNGGAHASNGLSIQEFMIIPDLPPEESLRASSEIYATLKQILKKKGHFVGVGDEGGFAPNVKDADEAIELILEAVNKTGYTNSIKLGLDVAASELFKDDSYLMDGKLYNSNELLEFYKNLIRKYPIVSIEDPYDQDDFKAWSKITDTLMKTQIVGDDIFVTQKDRLEKGIKEKAANAIIIKPNQVGTLSETIQTILLAKKSNFKIVVSHRSGETEDTFIADLAIACSADYMKAGALARGERVCKYNRLLRIQYIF